jgi:DNA-binding GntR family transcriptional regulator
MRLLTNHRSIEKRTIKPISNPEDIRRLTELLNDVPRDLLLFILATQTGLTMRQLLRLKVRDLNRIDIGDTLPIAGVKISPNSTCIMNKAIYEAFHLYLDRQKPDLDDFLFKSRKGSKPLTLTGASHLIRKWFRTANLKYLSGAGSLRKTYQAQHQKSFKAKPKLEKVNLEQTFKPIQNVTLQEAVYQEILQTIISGRIPPGERLFADKIAKQTNVSETPAREALARLEATGFISRSNRKGYSVNELSQEDVREIVKIRINLECMAVEEACLNVTEEVIYRLEKSFQEYKNAINDSDRYYLLNKEFHQMIYACANMPILQKLIEQLWGRMSPYLNILISYTNYDPKPAWEYHQGMINGIKNRNSKEACEWLKKDLNRAELLVEKEIEKRKQ